MKGKFLLPFLIIGILLFNACSNGLADNPIEVVDKVKVGMTEDELRQVVNVNYFQENKSFLMVTMSDVIKTDNGFKYKISDDTDAPYYGYLFFSVESDIDVAFIIFKCRYLETSGSLDDIIYEIGILPFATAKQIAEEHSTPLWHLRD